MECTQRFAAIAPCGGFGGIDLQGGANQARGVGRFASLQGQHAQKVQACRIAGLVRQNLAVHAFGFRQATLLVQVHCLLQAGVDFCLSHFVERWGDTATWQMVFG